MAKPNQAQGTGRVTRPPNQTQATGHVSTKPKAKKGYRWGDGRGPVHSRPLKKRNGGGGGGGGGQPAPRTDYTAPLSYKQIAANANAATQQRYGQVESQQALQGQQIPAWFQQYRDSLQGGQTQAQQSYQPAIAQQQQLAQQTGQNLGLQGQAGQQDQLAAAGREALAHLGLAQLQNALSQTTNYYAGRKGVADAAQIGANTQLATARQQTAKDKGAYRQSQIDQGVQTERNYGISVAHQNAENAAFGLDQFKAQSQADYNKGRLKLQAKGQKAAAKAKAQTVNQYGYTTAQWSRFSPAHRQQVMKDLRRSVANSPGGLTPAQRRAEQNRIAGIREKSGKALDRLDSIQNDYGNLTTSRVTTGRRDSNNKPVLVNGVPETRPITRKEIIGELRKKGFSADEIHLALLLREKKLWSPSDVRLAHQLGIRVPRKYIKPRYSGGGGNGGAPGANGQSRPT